MLPVAVARSSCDANAIRYVLPVLWMTSLFHIIKQMGQNQRQYETIRDDVSTCDQKLTKSQKREKKEKLKKMQNRVAQKKRSEYNSPWM